MKKLKLEGFGSEKKKETNDGVKENNKTFRKTKLYLPKKVYITNGVYKILRKQKKIQKKSMAEIVINLVTRSYKKVSTRSSKYQSCTPK